MFRTQRASDAFYLRYLLLVFCLGYLAIAFPRAYFRHDDWLMIGNVVRIIPEDWKFLFEPYLIFNSIKDVWFFRPWFKLFLYLNFVALGYQYYAWLAMNLIFTVGALFLGYLTIRRLTSETKKALISVAFFVSSVHFHFGSLVWVGEGTMNCPQLFCLFLNFYFFSCFMTGSVVARKIGVYIIAFVAFVISLGFKESSIFHLPFLLVLFFQKEPLKFSRKFFWVFIPYFIVACLYLYFRLHLLPFNEGYKPHAQISFVLKPALFLFASIGLPILTMLLSSVWHKVEPKELSKLGGFLSQYLVFFLPFFISYVGHGFFSPGWLTAPGIYMAFLLGLKLPSNFANRQILLTSLLLNFVISSGLVFYQTNSIKWWSWYKPQRQIVELIDQLGNSSTQRVRIFNCETTSDRLTPLIRVVGYDASIREVFWLKHKTLPEVSILPCENIGKTSLADKPHTLNLKWSFPEFTVVAN